MLYGTYHNLQSEMCACCTARKTSDSWLVHCCCQSGSRLTGFYLRSYSSSSSTSSIFFSFFRFLLNSSNSKPLPSSLSDPSLPPSLPLRLYPLYFPSIVVLFAFLSSFSLFLSSHRVTQVSVDRLLEFYVVRCVVRAVAATAADHHGIDSYFPPLQSQQ